jgi:hypothetical protein
LHGFENERTEASPPGKIIQHQAGAVKPPCHNASHFSYFLDAINGKMRVELLADGTSLFSRERDVKESVITLILAAETMASELALHGLDPLNDVVRTRICDVLLSLLRRCSINEKLALTTMARIGAEDGIRGHG